MRHQFHEQEKINPMSLQLQVIQDLFQAAHKEHNETEYHLKIRSHLLVAEFVDTVGIAPLLLQDSKVAEIKMTGLQKDKDIKGRKPGGKRRYLVVRILVWTHK